MTPKINPEWEALEGKPHLVPITCVPDQYKVIKVGPQPPTCSEECKRCGEEITYKHDDPLVYCPGCNTNTSSVSMPSSSMVLGEI